MYDIKLLEYDDTVTKNFPVEHNVYENYEIHLFVDVSLKLYY